MKRLLPLLLTAAVLALGWLINPTGQQLHGLPVVACVFVVVMALQVLGFAHAWWRRTEKFYDLFGSVSFITAAVMALVLSPRVGLYQSVLSAMVILWAVRLGSFLFQRVMEVGEDRRFRAIKQSFWSFLTIWTVQGVWVAVTSSAAVVAILEPDRQPNWAIASVGAALWFLGLLLEVVADRQKQRFRADPANAGQFIAHGVWAWCRHPNYFGEIVLWCGVFIAAAPVLVGWQWLTALSPVLVVVLLTKVSGIPALARRGQNQWGDDPGYQQYLANTPLLVPRPFGRRRP